MSSNVHALTPNQMLCLSFTSDANTATTKGTERCVASSLIILVASVSIQWLACARSLLNLRVRHAISIIQVHHSCIAEPASLPRVLPHAVQLEHEAVHEAGRLDQIVAVRIR